MTSPMTAGEICNREVVVAPKSMALDEAARLMRERHVGSIVAVEETAEGGAVAVGMLTDRDIVTAVVAKSMDAATLRIDDVMSRDIATARADDSVTDVLAVMRRKGVRRMPVTDAQGRLVGIVTVDDLLGLIAEQLRSVVQALVAQPRLEQQARP